jgi:hypothetical protein
MPLCCVLPVLSCPACAVFGVAVLCPCARQVPEDEDDTCELELPSPLDMAELVRGSCKRPVHMWCGAALMFSLF